jgi:hypothetical protein
MSILIKGKDFGPTEQVTSTKLDELVDNASFTDTSENSVAYTGTTGTCLQGGGLEVTSLGQLQIADSGVNTSEISDSAVTTAKIASSAVTTAKISDANVTNAKLATNAVSTAKITDDAVTQAKIADDAVGANQLASNAVVTASIVDSNVTTAKIADDAITSAKIADNAINSANMITGAVINTSNIADDAVTSAKIANNAVTTAKITDLNVTTAKIAADAITTAKIADDVELGGNPTTTTQSAGNNSTRIATTEFVTTAVTNSFAPSIVFTSDARNGESQRYYKNLTEIDDPNNLITINSTSEIEFASTGTYMIEAGIGLDDNDVSGTGDTYNIQLVKGNSSITTISFQGVTFANWSLYKNGTENKLVTFQVPYTVSNTTNDRLSIYASPVSDASSSEWEGFATIKITKIA